MEKRENEKAWDNFWMTGKVDDYLSYRNSVKERNDNGTVSECDRDGANNHAHIGI